MTLRDPKVLSRMRAMYEPLLADPRHNETARYVTGLVDLVRELLAEAEQARWEREGLVALLERPRPVTAVEAVRRLYDAVGSMPMIAASAGVSAMTVHRALKGSPSAARTVAGGLSERPDGYLAETLCDG